MRNAFMGATVLALGFALTSAGSAEGLGPGSPAPALEVKEWFKGQPIKALEKGKIYVVEFWATWCGPCKTSIPHITEMAKANKDVTFIGVSIWEDNDGSNIKKFVDEMGSKMDYNVGYSGNKEGMAQTWMTAAGQNGIPSAFIVKDGVVQWIGHPMGMKEPLAEVKAGTFDLAAFKKTFEVEAEANRKQMESQKKIQETIALFNSGKRAEAKQRLDEIVAGNADMAQAADTIKFGWLAEEDSAAWEKKASAYAKSGDKENLMKLCGFAIRQVKAPEKMQRLGKNAIEWALEGSKGEDLMVLQYADYFYRQTGDTKAQLDTTTKILAILPKSEMKDNKEYKEAMEKQKKELEAKVKG